MSETYEVPAFASCAETVVQLMSSGEPFDDVAYAIDEVEGLSEDARSALWLLAFSMRNRGDRRAAPPPAHLTVVS